MFVKRSVDEAIQIKMRSNQSSQFYYYNNLFIYKWCPAYKKIDIVSIYSNDLKFDFVSILQRCACSQLFYLW